MRQAIMTSPGRIELRNAPTPVPAPGEALLRIRRIGVCGSDVHVYHGKHPYTPFPVIQGHEFSAVVESVGDGVTGFAPGMPVTAMPQIVCDTCAPCSRGDYHICDSLRVQGFQAPGCAQPLFVTKADKLVRLPDGFTPEQGALVEPTAVAVHAVARAGDIAGKNVAVMGAGPIGNLVAQVAMAAGARVLITDLSDYRLELACRCGISDRCNVQKEAFPNAAARVFGDGGFSAALECVGVEASLSAAVENVAKGGTVVIVGVFAEKPRVDVGLVQDRELNLLGSLMYQRQDYERAIELIDNGKVQTEPLDSKHFPFEEYLAAYQFIEAQGDRSMKVFIDVTED